MIEYCSFVILSQSEDRIRLLSKIIANVFPLHTIVFANNINELKEVLNLENRLNNNSNNSQENSNSSEKHCFFLIIDYTNEESSNEKKVASNEFVNEINLTILSLKDNYNFYTYYLINKEVNLLNKFEKLFISNFLVLPIDNNTIANHLLISYNQFRNSNKLKESNYSLKKINKELELDFESIVQLTSKFVQTRLPLMSEVLDKVALTSSWIANQFPNFDEIDIKDIRIASYLSLIGKTYLPDYLINEKVLDNGRLTNPIMFQVPLTAKEMFKDINRFNNISHLIFHIYENLDGSGIPERISAWQIPLGSRIIRVVLDFYEMVINGQDKEEVIKYMESNSKRIYDNRVIYLLNQYLIAHPEDGNKSNEIPIKLTDLTEGMVISRDIIATSGMKILSHGTVITNRIKEIIYSHITSDPILGFIFIYKDKI